MATLNYGKRGWTLSQIWVHRASTCSSRGIWLSTQVLSANAFGSYRDLMEQMTLNQRWARTSTWRSARGTTERELCSRDNAAFHDRTFYAQSGRDLSA